jgi:alpha/beta superfamily hydrolase
MVAKGQFLERMTHVPSDDGLSLEGLFHEGRAPVPCVIASPHPVFGGSMDSAVCAELAWAISRKGLATLRFNYRGVGASQGKGHVTAPHAREELADLRAAARLLASTAKSARVNVAGYSFGAWLGSWLALEEPRVVEKLVLVSPPVNEMPFDWEALGRSGIDILVVHGALDRFVPGDLGERLRAFTHISVEKLPETDHWYLRNLAQAGALAAEHVAQPEQGPLVDLAGDDGPPLELDLEGR